jgi:hypothetical protein
MGVDFSAPLFSAKVDVYVKTWASKAQRAYRHKLLDFYVREGNLELEIQGTSPNDPDISRTLEPAKPVLDPTDINFRIPAKQFQGVPVGSVIAAYRMNRPDHLVWEISGDICANPLVTFQIIGSCPISEP